MSKVILRKIKRFLQEPGTCAFCATASVGNYYNKQIDYNFICSILPPDGTGIYTADIVKILNKIGFNKTTVVSADLSQLDFAWNKLSKTTLIKELKKYKRHFHKDNDAVNQASGYIDILSDKQNNNKIIVDIKFGDYIRNALDRNIPVLASFNWNLFFNYPKYNENGVLDAIKGDYEYHEVVIYGYDDKGVYILDSNHNIYKGRLKKYSKGRYKINWEILMTVMGQGDLIIPEKYSNELV